MKNVFMKVNLYSSAHFSLILNVYRTLKLLCEICEPATGAHKLCVWIGRERGKEGEGVEQIG